MKKVTSLIFAVVSTMFLFVGATRAAEKFDPIKHSTATVITGMATDELLPPPCNILD